MKLPSCPRTLIINILRKNPEGLTLTSIAILTGLHRHTATKYIYELKGAGIINERDVGSAKLCYLKEGFSKEDEKKVVSRLNGTGRWTFNRKSSTGQVQILTLFLFLFLIPATVIIAQNATQTINSTLNITGLVIGQNWTENITTDSSENFSETVNQTALNGTFGNFTILWENGTTHETIANGTVSSEENASGNQTVSGIDISNITVPETNGTVVIEPQNPVLDVRIASPDRIIRGDSFDISAVVTNSGNAEARNVSIFWEIPSGFEVISGEISAECGPMPPDSECTASLTLSSTTSTDIGKREFKVKVNYEK